MEMERINNDNVCHPKHYTQGGIECIDALKAATVGKTGIEAVCVANVIKYCWRYEEKNGLEDVRKAQFYINRLIQELEEKEPTTTTLDNNIDCDIGDCIDCTNFDMDENSDPCCRCKGTAVPNSLEYIKRPSFFKLVED